MNSDEDAVESAMHYSDHLYWGLRDSSSNPEKDNSYFTFDEEASSKVEYEMPAFGHMTWEQFTNIKMVDMEIMYFPNIDAAEKFYTYYSFVKGFSIRRHKHERDKVDKSITRRLRWTCSKEGTTREHQKKSLKSCVNELHHIQGEEDLEEQEDGDEAEQQPIEVPKKKKVVKGRRRLRVNCGAMFQIGYDSCEKLYCVRKFVAEHNHKLALPSEVQFLRSHRCVREHDVAQIKSLQGLQVHISRAYEYIVIQRGGYENVGFTLKDLYNKLFRDRMKAAEENGGDAQSAITWMNLKKVADKDFFVRHTVDSKGRLKNMFWRDGTSLNDYHAFGDVLILDSTYKTNMYNTPLVVFVGSNNHRATVSFGFAIVTDEKEETYSWVMEKFLEGMNQKQPISVLTDGDESIRKAVLKHLPQSRHRLCAWHISRNIVNNIKNEDAQKKLGELIYASRTISDWESEWQQIAVQYNLVDIPWMKTMYEKRKRWAECYFMGQFFGGMCSTERCEGMNATLKKHLTRHTLLSNVLPGLELTLRKFRNRVSLDNFDAKNTHRKI